MRSRILAAISLVYLCLICGVLQAQHTTGNLEGRLVDPQGNPVASANVLASGPNLQGERGGASDKDGVFHILALPVGPYTVKIGHIGHNGAIYEKIAVRLGKTTTLGEIELQPRAVEMSEVVVTSSRPIIDPNATTIGMNIEADVFEVLPIERNYRSVVTLVPQASISYLGDGINIAGSTGLENIFYIDGTNVTDPAKGLSSTNLPFNFVKEVEVKSGGYEAEYGRALGGIVNVVTYSGGNELQGSAFGFFTNNRFVGDPTRGFVEFERDGFTQWDGGLSFGGPIIRDRLWYYAAYNRTVEKEDLQVLGLGSFEDKRTSNIFAGKLTWQPVQNSNLVFTILGDPSEHHRVANPAPVLGSPSGLENIDPFLSLAKQGGVSLSLNGRFLLRENVLIEAGLSRLEQRQAEEGATDRGKREPLVVNNLTGIWSGGFVTEGGQRNKRTAGKITASWFGGNHILKGGFEYEENVLDEATSFKEPGQLLAEPEGFLAIYVERDFVSRTRVPTFFLQDAWQVSNRLQINAGVRWDGIYLIDTNGAVAQSIGDQYQPRLGLIYQPGKIGTQKISASFGRFYEQLPTVVPSVHHSEWRNGIIFFSENPLPQPVTGDTTDVFDLTIVPKIEGLEGQHYDESTLGYERQIQNRFRFSIRGIHRTLKQAIETGWNFQRVNDSTVVDLGFFYGNPGSGDLDFLPKVKRNYYALEVVFQKYAGERANFAASYVWSRNYGNYAGLFDSDTRVANVNFNNIFDTPEQVPNSTGLLPNDRTHIFKFFGSYNFDFGLNLGTSFFWQSGTPLNDFGGTTVGLTRMSFLQKRGTAGRTPSTWDLNLRATYDLSKAFRTTFNTKLYLDILHIGSPRKAVDFDQIHFFSVDNQGNQINENPNYLEPLLFQPPMTVRLGLEVGF